VEKMTTKIQVGVVNVKNDFELLTIKIPAKITSQLHLSKNTEYNVNELSSFLRTKVPNKGTFTSWDCVKELTIDENVTIFYFAYKKGKVKRKHSCVKGELYDDLLLVSAIGCTEYENLSLDNVCNFTTEYWSSCEKVSDSVLNGTADDDDNGADDDDEDEDEDEEDDDDDDDDDEIEEELDEEIDDEDIEKEPIEAEDDDEDDDDDVFDEDDEDDEDGGDDADKENSINQKFEKKKATNAKTKAKSIDPYQFYEKDVTNYLKFEHYDYPSDIAENIDYSELELCNNIWIY
jgi:hypothetical protein